MAEVQQATVLGNPADLDDVTFLEGIKRKASNQTLVTPRPPLYVYFLAGCAALNSVNIGFDIGVSSGVAVCIRSDLKLQDIEIGLFLGSLHFTAAIGAMNSHIVSDRLGRRLTFTVAQVVLLCGVLVAVLSNDFTVLMLGRVLVGVGVGISFAIDSLYIAEVAPAAHRGMLGSWAEIAVNFGIILGFIADWAFAGLPVAVNWRMMMVCGTLFPIVLIVISLTIMPESPRWLVANGRADEAAIVLSQTHPACEDMTKLVQGIREQIQIDARLAHLGWAPLLRPGPATRSRVLAGIGVAVAQQINGSESVVLYSPEIFKRAGVASTESDLFAITILVGTVKVLFIVLSSYLLDSIGRRPLLLVSTILMSASLFLVSVSNLSDADWLAVLGVCCFMAAFSIGIGPVTWLLAAELFPSHVRAKAMSLATCSNRMTSGLVALTFLPLSSFLGGQASYFAMFAAVTAATAIGSYLFVPETKRQTLEELSSHGHDMQNLNVNAADKCCQDGSLHEDATKHDDDSLPAGTMSKAEFELQRHDT